MSSVQPPQCKLSANNDFTVHQYYNTHSHQSLVSPENNQKLGSNILTIATNGILDTNLFTPSKDNGTGLSVLDTGSVTDKLAHHYSTAGTDFLPQAYTNSHQHSSWYQTPNSSRPTHFHNQFAQSNVNTSNGPFPDSWTAAMVNVIPHCNYPLPSSPVYGHSVNAHRHSHQTTQYADRSPYQYPYNVSSSYLQNAVEPINTLPTSPEVQVSRTTLEQEVNSGEANVCDEKPQITSGDDIDKSDDEALSCGATATFASRPQPARSPFEWMKKPSYQNQPTSNGNYFVTLFLNDTIQLAGKTRTRDKYRVVYSDHQRLELEKEFHYSRYITIRRKSELAQLLGLSERQVKIWFQNRRAKERKQQKKREELMVKGKDQNSHLHSHHLLTTLYTPQNDAQLSIQAANGAF
ncbi:Homeotic protein caudal-like protein [Leptotrombidium deliense]|uniref:Homeotic protein caudal-like protein n=1 Tax=Leptotrombidium deliense TaxID=299467 RepID=A0A443SFC5_9ACAR|nr:Homeotic protein caudal-like protein [Leptotrombidium deliense]